MTSKTKPRSSTRSSRTSPRTRSRPSSRSKKRPEPRVTKKFLLDLFEEGTIIRPFKDEIAAVGDGRKPLSYASISDEWLWAGRSTEDLDRAWELGLIAILVPGPAVRTRKLRLRNLNLYITRPEHAWRVFAHEHLWGTVDLASHWNTDFFEAMQSTLFGYPPKVVDAWLAWHRNSRPERGAAVHLLLTDEQRNALDRFGMRAFTPEAIGSGIVAFHISSYPVPTRHANRHCAPLHLARVGMYFDDVKRLLFTPVGGRRPAITMRAIAADEATAINKAMQTKIQLWNGTRWR